jgi:hypothetical protein
MSNGEDSYDIYQHQRNSNQPGPIDLANFPSNPKRPTRVYTASVMTDAATDPKTSYRCVFQLQSNIHPWKPNTNKSTDGELLQYADILYNLYLNGFRKATFNDFFTLCLAMEELLLLNPTEMTEGEYAVHLRMRISLLYQRLDWDKLAEEFGTDKEPEADDEIASGDSGTLDKLAESIGEDEQGPNRSEEAASTAGGTTVDTGETKLSQTGIENLN